MNERKDKGRLSRLTRLSTTRTLTLWTGQTVWKSSPRRKVKCFGRAPFFSNYGEEMRAAATLIPRSARR